MNGFDYFTNIFNCQHVGDSLIILYFKGFVSCLLSTHVNVTNCTFWSISPINFFSCLAINSYKDINIFLNGISADCP